MQTYTVIDPWNCLVCGYRNTDEFCVECSQRRGSWLCDCGRMNGKGDTECSDCGRAKPEE